ncbi:hypothetical protein KBTX_01622 [wastewater metagenome]|uniref:Uncharacterized protein n=2 Tax=unclassified sequences TaxID=12908 RepID=A0A5B8RCZ5_9ZZZZ|nr:hypothetical protein [Arhodomonas sp. KWT]QEA05302.1 hypothetical protein KBTEX_01622 [uncultured organism]
MDSTRKRRLIDQVRRTLRVFLEYLAVERKVAAATASVIADSGDTLSPSPSPVKGEG